MIDLAPNGILFVAKSIGKVKLQSKFDLTQQDTEKVSLSAGQSAITICKIHFGFILNWKEFMIVGDNFSFDYEANEILFDS